MPFWNNGHRIYKNNIWLLPYCLIPILVPIIYIQFILQQYWLYSSCLSQQNYVHARYSNTGYPAYAYHSVLTHIQQSFIQHSPAIPYHAVYSYTYAHVSRLSIQFDYIPYHADFACLRIQTLGFIDSVPCRLCMLTYSDHRSHIYTQASTLASPLIYNYPSHYSSGLFMTIYIDHI